MWHNLAAKIFLMMKDVTIGGDLNLTLSLKEIWGSHGKLDSLSSHFTNLFRDNALVDVQLGVLGPMWTNGRSRNEALAKRMDQYVVSKVFLNSLNKFKSWTTKL